MTKSHCPHCGEAIRRQVETITSPCGGFHVDDFHVLVDGRTVWLTKTESVIVKLLAAEWGELVSRDEIYWTLHSLLSGCDQPNWNVIKVHIWNIRRKLDGTGFQIRNVRRGGYLIEAQHDQHQRGELDECHQQQR